VINAFAERMTYQKVTRSPNFLTHFFAKVTFWTSKVKEHLLNYPFQWVCQK